LSVFDIGQCLMGYLGHAFEVSLAGADMASGLVDMFGARGDQSATSPIIQGILHGKSAQSSRASYRHSMSTRARNARNARAVPRAIGRGGRFTTRRAGAMFCGAVGGLFQIDSICQLLTACRQARATGRRMRSRARLADRAADRGHRCGREISAPIRTAFFQLAESCRSDGEQLRGRSI